MNRKENLLGTKNSWKYKLLSLGRFGINFVKLAKDDVVDYHDHDYNQLKVILKGSYYETKLRFKVVEGYPLIDSEGGIWKWLPSYLAKNDAHKMTGLKDTYMLYFWYK